MFFFLNIMKEEITLHGSFVEITRQNISCDMSIVYGLSRKYVKYFESAGLRDVLSTTHLLNVI